MFQVSCFLDWLVVAFFCLPFFFTAKALTLDWKLRLKESLFILCAGLVASAVILLNRALHDVFSHVLGDLTLIMLLVLYLHKMKSYPIKKAVPLMLLSCAIIIIAELILSIILHVLFLPTPPIFSTEFTAAFPTRLTLRQTISFVIPLYTLITFLVLTLLRLSKRARQVINRNVYLQSTIMLFSIYCITFLIVIVNIWRAMVLPTYTLTPNIPFVFILICILFALFSLYTISVYAEHEKQQKDLESKNLQNYIDDLEQQQVSILRFKHDYQNLLLSMQSFIHDKDWTGLEHFYASTIKTASLALTESRSAFDHLHKIKLREIKGILGAKLIQAQHLNERTHAIFEANENIDNFPIDSVSLVRMLGIILDNAIEALDELGYGTLFVSCLKWEAGITLIVENTCPSQMPPLDLLWQPTFSTRGARRGRGLSILSDLINAHPNVSLDTTIESGLFRQALLIEVPEDDDRKRKEGKYK